MHIITGGAGFIGSALLWELNNMGVEDVVVVDNLASSPKWRNLVKRKYVDYIHRDQFREMILKKQLPWQVDSIVHLGACSSTTETDADFLMENNFHYSRDVCRFALDKGARIINASSAATYGAGERGFGDDVATALKLRPINMYGYSKQLFDLWLMRENLLGNVASLKFFNVYGPNEYHKGSMSSVIFKFFHEINDFGQARLFASNDPDIANGAQRRDFVYVKDCARLLALLMLERLDINGILNVGTGHAATYNAVVRAVFQTLGKPENIEYVPIPENISKNYQNFTQAEMGWLEREGVNMKFTAIEAGIADYVGNYLANADLYL